MIVLLSCSINLYANDYHISSTGELEQKDSVYISYDDIRNINSKLIELKYEKEINNNLKSIIVNDNSIIDNYNNTNNLLVKQNKRLTRQRNILGVITTISIGFIIGLTIK